MHSYQSKRIEGSKIRDHLECMGVLCQRASSLLHEMYREIQWKPWLLDEEGSHFWKYSQNRKWYLNWLAETLSLQTMEDWYRVSKSDIGSYYN